jgi:hypothetical protein
LEASTGATVHWDNSTGAAALFCRPCQSKERTASFFRDFAGQPLDPLEWIEKASDENINRYAMDQSEQSAPARLYYPADYEAVKQARQEWRISNHYRRQDNENFFRLGCRLAKAGLEEAEITEILNAEASIAHKPSDRRAQIPSVLASLQRYRMSRSLARVPQP